MTTEGMTPVAGLRVAPLAAVIGQILDSPEVAPLIRELDEREAGGRRGYGARALLGAAIAKSAYAIPSWTRTTRLIAEHRALSEAIGGTPSEWSCYRFSSKLRSESPRLHACIDRVIGSLREQYPEMGRDVALDGSDAPAYSNGQKFLYNGGPERERFSDPDASWGHRSAIGTRSGGGFFGYKAHAVVDVATGLPLAWRIETARMSEHEASLPVVNAMLARGFQPDTLAADRGYDFTGLYDGCEERGIRPIIPLRQTPGVKAGRHHVPTCPHGEWKFAGADFKKRAAKYRCPAGECQPKSVWIKASRLRTLVPRESKRWKDLYRSRVAVEREFGRLKNDYGLTPLRVRGIERVRLHADLTMLARLSLALTRARAVPLAA